MTIISNIFFKISYRDLHRKTAFHSRLFLGFPKDGINMIWNEKVLIKPLISKINILREFLLCPPPTLLLVRFKPWQQCWRWWQVPQIFVLPRDSTPLRFSSCVIVTVATMLMMMMMITTTMLMTTLPSLFCLANQQRIPSPLGPAPITQTFSTIAWKIRVWWSTQRANIDRYKDHLEGQLTRKIVVQPRSRKPLQPSAEKLRPFTLYRPKSCSKI